jgi:uncharacterized membrane protein
MKLMHFCCLFALALGLAACGDGLPDVECTGEIPQYADVTALTKCSVCHSSKVTGAARHDAPSSLNLDTEEAARAHAKDAASEVNGGDMPPSGSGISLTGDEKQALYKWALCK